MDCSCLNLFCTVDFQFVLENFMFFPRWVHILPVVAIVDLYGVAVFMVWRKIETARSTVLLAPPPLYATFHVGERGRRTALNPCVEVGHNLNKGNKYHFLGAEL